MCYCVFCLGKVNSLRSRREYDLLLQLSFEGNFLDWKLFSKITLNYVEKSDQKDQF
jgi:hypothetical protein